MTLEEMERRAYADGDTQKATLLARAIDGDPDIVAKARQEGYEEGYDDGLRDGKEIAESA